MPKLRKKSSMMKAREARQKRRNRLMDLSGEEREQWLARHAEYQRERRARLSPASLAQLRKANAARNRRRRAAMSQAQLDEVRKINRERARRRRDGIRAGLLADTVVSPDFFSSVGLRKHHEDKHESQPETQASPDASSVSGTKKSRGKKRNSKERIVQSPEMLLGSVDVELTEGHTELQIGLEV